MTAAGPDEATITRHITETFEDVHVQDAMGYTFFFHGEDPPGPGGIIETAHDYTALDRLMPHPHYANMHWVCVLAPCVETFDEVRPLIAEAYEIAKRRSEKKAART